MDLHRDLRDLFQAFAAEAVEYLIIGGYAVALHATPRFTKDLDLWIGDGAENVQRVHRALATFGAPASTLRELLASGPEDIVWMGAPPILVEIFRTIPGVRFEDAFARREVVEWAGTPVSVIGLDDLIAAKRATARERDLSDIKLLEKASTRRGAAKGKRSPS